MTNVMVDTETQYNQVEYQAHTIIMLTNQPLYYFLLNFKYKKD